MSCFLVWSRLLIWNERVESCSDRKKHIFRLSSHQTQEKIQNHEKEQTEITEVTEKKKNL